MARAGAVNPKHFWIDDDVAADSKNQLGTLEAPFSGAARAFDLKMRELIDRHGPCVIHLLPGTYETQGTGWPTASRGPLPTPRWQLREGQRILGSGMYNTVIKRIKKGDPVVIASRKGADMVEIAELTVDANYDRAEKPKETLHGIYLAGERSALRRVRAIGVAGHGESEGFALSIAPHGDDGELYFEGVGVLFEGCEVEETGGGWLNGLNIAGNAVARDNRVILPRITEGKPVLMQAYNAASCKSVFFSGNYSYGGNVGLYSDYKLNENTLIHGNRFVECIQGIRVEYQAPSYLKNLSIFNNTIELNSSSSTLVRVGVSIWDKTGWRNHNQPSHHDTVQLVHIFGNTIKAPGHTNYSSPAKGIDLVNMDYAFATQNKIDAALNWGLKGNKIYAWENFTLTGDLFRPDDWVAPATSAPLRRKTIDDDTALEPGNVYTIKTGDRYIGLRRLKPIVIRLPDATEIPSGKEYIIMNEAQTTPSGSWILTIKGQKINNTLSRLSYPTAYTSMRLISDGSNYFRE